ncbi:MAG: ABC transporter permease, partial [Streptomyces sp.]|uniref:ABC transporter permease n=1 Tax=Streptomyces sp. TaxID=1931 RepID=UPI003D6B73DE
PLPGPAQWPAITVVLVLGAAGFCALGVGVASLIRNAEAAPAVVQFVLFPLVFVSGTYMPIDSDILNSVTAVLPVRPFNESLIGAFTGDGPLAWMNLGVLLGWGIAGAIVAVRRFRWDPRPE